MKRIGPIDADSRWRRSFDPVDALARAILYQQLSGKAAATIVGRVEQAIGSERFHSDTLGRVDDAGLRACGVSGNKTLALRDLALRESRGEIPDLRRMSTMAEDDIIAALVPIRGIGRWTVEMMLMFRSEEHTSELQSLMRISYAVFCLKKKKTQLRPIIHEYIYDA